MENIGNKTSDTLRNDCFIVLIRVVKVMMIVVRFNEVETQKMYSLFNCAFRVSKLIIIFLVCNKPNCKLNHQIKNNA